MVAVVSSFFLLFMASNIMGVILYWRIIKIIRDVDPQKYRDLTSPLPVIGKMFPVNQFKFGAFVKTKDSLGSQELADNLRAFRKAVTASRFSFALLLVAFVATVVRMI